MYIYRLQFLVHPKILKTWVILQMVSSHIAWHPTTILSTLVEPAAYDNISPPMLYS